MLVNPVMPFFFFLTSYVPDIVLFTGSADPAQCVVRGLGVTTAVVGQATEIWILARDSYGNLCSTGGESFKITWRGLGAAAQASLLDHCDGTYEYTYLCSQAGRYTLAISLAGVSLPGSPFTIKVGSHASHATGSVTSDRGSRSSGSTRSSSVGRSLVRES